MRNSLFFWILAGIVCLLISPFVPDVGTNVQFAIFGIDDVAAGLIIGGGASLLGSVIGGLSGASAQREANSMQYDMWKQQFDYSRLNDKENRKFNMYEAQKARDWQEAHDIDMFNMDVQNRSYENQRKQMESAGLNPFMMFSGGNLVQPPVASAGSGSHASSPSPTSQPNIPKIEPVTSQTATMISATSGAIANVANALKSTSESKAIEKKLTPEIEQIKESVNTMQSQQRVNDSIVSLNEAEKQYKSTLDSIEQIKLKYADQKEFAEINRICNESQKFIADAYLASLQGETEIANANLRNAEASLMKFKETAEREQLPFIISNLKKQGKLFDAQAANAYMTGNAAQVAASAQKMIAWATSAEKQAIVQKLKKDGEYLESMISGQKLDNAFNLVTFMNRAESIAQTLASEKIITNQQFEHLMMLKKQNNWYEIMNVLNAVSLGMIGGGQAAQGASSVYKTFGSGKTMGKIGF